MRGKNKFRCGIEASQRPLGKTDTPVATYCKLCQSRIEVREAGKEKFSAREVERPQKFQNGLFPQNGLHKFSFCLSPHGYMPLLPATSKVLSLGPWRVSHGQGHIAIYTEKKGGGGERERESELYIHCFNVTKTPQKGSQPGLELTEDRDCGNLSPQSLAQGSPMVDVQHTFQAAGRNKVPWECGGQGQLTWHRRSWSCAEEPIGLHEI